jgi:hypothetical protein
VPLGVKIEPNQQSRKMHENLVKKEGSVVFERLHPCNGNARAQNLTNPETTVETNGNSPNERPSLEPSIEWLSKRLPQSFGF